MIKNEKINTIPYDYKNVPIPGGGFVTGFVFHPTKGNILYARTDIGGCYRFDFDKKLWIPLVDEANNNDLSATFPLSIAINKSKPEEFYIACGDGEHGRLSISKDYGESFTNLDIPSPIHGNYPGRGTGERLVIDDNNSEVIYFGSMKKGLLRSEDGGKTWSGLKVGEYNETEITFVYVDARTIIKDSIHRSKTIIVGTTGEANKRYEKIRGNSLYISNDGGESFLPLPEPEPVITEQSCIAGFVGSRCSFDGTYLYITAVSTGAYASYGFSSYACDSNHPADGRLLRFLINEDGIVSEYTDVTPMIAAIPEIQETYKVKDNNKTEILYKQHESYEKIKIGCGLGGVATTKQVPGLVVCTTIARNSGEMILISRDCGVTWSVNLHGLTTGKIEFTVPYMKPEYNGNSSLIHWLSDIKINPHNPNHAIFNTGTGVFMTFNLLDSDCKWISETYGIEETVHLNIYSPPEGKVKLIDILGDLGGFAFSDLDKPAENTFADREGNRYITCCNGDYSDLDSNYVVATPRGNWTGKTKGGVIFSTDQCKTFNLLSHPFGLSPFIDELLTEINKPNINSGWAAISPDCKTIIWSIAKRISLPANAVVYTLDAGKTWFQSKVYDISGKLLQDEMIIPKEPANLKAGGWKAYKEYIGNIIGLKVFADRVNSNIFYGFGDHSKLYVSKDGGRSFYQLPTPSGMPILNLAGIDGGNLAEIRVESNKEGVIWIAFGEGGLWKLEYHMEQNEFKAFKITKDKDVIDCQGMGKGLNDQCKALYVSGTMKGVYGIWQSLDEGKTWNQINNQKQMYGQIRGITGDPRVFGRVYVATGTRGVLYGEPCVI
jgi:xyloglucan-specific exo-beta-1,4-glucanase